jgi:hypothetical protein
MHPERFSVCVELLRCNVVKRCARELRETTGECNAVHAPVVASSIN